MNMSSTWTRVLLILGFLCMLVGAMDPLEGSLIIFPGAGMVALASFLGGSRHRKLLCWSFGSLAIGVGAMFVISAFGGIRLPGEYAGHSMWWGLFILPYPVGWIVGVVGAILLWVETFKNPKQPKQPA